MSRRARQRNVGTYCLLAAEYDIPNMLRTVDNWLAEHCELALPPLPPRGTHREGDCRMARSAAKAAARKRAEHWFMPVLTLMRDYKLTRFEEAATRRVDQLCESSLSNRTVCKFCRHWPERRWY